ncbi:MAG: hypothetical protein L3J04_09420, partial [Robiginitomaculum sp.]|nr:hypothetical protein [Robiginitomaculum sp.]
EGTDYNAISFTARGRTFIRRGRSLDSLIRAHWKGLAFRKTELSENYTFDDLKASLPENADTILEKKPNGKLLLSGQGNELKGGVGSIIISYGPVQTTE